MSRPEPCILFVQTFTHPQLDEYVDEVLFAEPVVITGCEFLELNAPLSTPHFSLMGATYPPSFAMEIFVHCEGESRFRRLCQPFLYSHSSSNVLDVEVVVTNHLVLRGCYRSITLVVYGNTAEDLGQFSVDIDLDNSLASLVSSPWGKLEDLPPALLSVKLTIEELITTSDSFSLSFSDLDISCEMRLFLHLAFKIYEISYDESTLLKVVKTVISAVGYHFSSDYCGMVISKDDVWFRNSMYERENLQKIFSAISDARNELLELYKELQTLPGNGSLLQDAFQEPDSVNVTSQLLVDTLYRLFPFLQNSASLDIPVLYQNKQLILGLSMLLLVCLESESCFFYVNGGGMEHIVSLLGDDMQGTTAFTLLLLGVVETVTRHAVGCEAFLGWWPRNDDYVPVSKSEGYSNLLKLLLRKQRHDVASLASYILHRLRIYELASRYELSVLSIVSDHSLDCLSRVDAVNALGNAAAQMKQLVKSLNLCGPFEDPSPVANARKSLDHWKSEGHLQYNATSDYTALSKHNFFKWDVDLHLLSLLKESGFFPLSAALLSYPSMHATIGSAAQIFVEIAVFFQSLLLSILFSRSGLTFLLLQPEITSTIILSLQCFEEGSKLECPTLRQAAVLMSKGFFCHPQEVAMILEIHLRVGYAIDRLLSASPTSDEILWVLWDLCSIARSDCGRQAILSIGYFHEAIEVLLGALRSCKDSESISSSNGASRLDLATFHSAAEIFEILVSDSTSFSLRAWIGYAVELHKALHLSSPGSHRKDAPTRLLEWIDAGVVYHKNGSIGLLRYAAVLASGGDAHLSSASVLVSDSIDVENVVGDSSDASDSQVLDILLGKLVSDKFFDGITLRNTSIVQLTTAIRILALISENTDVAGYLFEEGAMTLIYVVLSSCKRMLEQLSNTYDYLVDGAECNSTSDLLLEWNQEQSLVDLILPSLVLLINLLRKLREAKEIYQNKKLLNTLLHLHREVSPRLAAYVADIYSHYPQLVLGFGAICCLVASVVAFWPVFGWKPSLFCCLLNNVQDTSSLPLGPKDACSVMYLLSDLFPKEGVWLWKNGIPPFSAVSTLSIETVLGPEVEKDIQWYLKPEHLTVLLTRLTPLLERIAQIVLQFSFTTLVVIKDMLRIFIIRIACQRAECADILLRPLICWMDHTISETIISDADHFKMCGSLNFISNLLEHPFAKILLSRTSSIRVLVNALKRCCDACIVDGKFDLDDKVDKDAPSFLSWYMPLLKSLALIFDSQTSTQIANISGECPMVDIVPEDSSMIGHHLLRLCQVVPVGKELLACMATLKEFISSDVGRRTLKAILLQSQTSVVEEYKGNENDAKEYVPDSDDWRIYPPFLQCWEKLLSCLDADDDTLNFAVETAYLLSSCALSLCVENHNYCGVSILKYLFGLAFDPRSALTSPDERLQDVLKLIILFEQKVGDQNFVHSATKADLQKITDVVEVMRLLLEVPLVSSTKVEEIPSDDFFLSTDSDLCANTKSLLFSSLNMIANDDGAAFNHVWKLIEITETESEPFSLDGFAEKFIWECPDTSSERVLTTSSGGKRKIASAEVSAKRARDSSTSEAGGSNASRGFTTLSTPVPTRRDTFRQRKPNTSRPPSMHVDDYVARERNTDALNSASHAVSSQREGQMGGLLQFMLMNSWLGRGSAKVQLFLLLGRLHKLCKQLMRIKITTVN
ncbi:hypothetical protein HPP92_005562 [Vanilla planifolia]|uniref:Virilizer N-terminal domain-containing protein n=1 Tax=Vanilla planifolia TaxID=51239 RepID=A0A835RZ12_VANPL|nr:hypothetical protein HPP92_005562 [Vanilla planifolia]